MTVQQAVGHEDTPSSVDKKLRLARSASEILASMSRRERADILEAFAEGLALARVQLVNIAVEETSIDAALLDAEMDRTVAQLRFMGEVIVDGDYLEIAVDTDRSTETVHRMLIPLGVVAIFGSSNFPFAYGVAGGDSASALAAGCAIVVKEHPSHPRTCEAILRTLHTALDQRGIPRSIVSLVSGFDAGQQIVQSPMVHAVGFTGSTKGGRALFDLAVGRAEPIPFYGELGSLNSAVVTPEAALQRGAMLGHLLAESLLRRGGQMCTKPGLIFLPSGASGDALLETMATIVEGSETVELLNEDVRRQFVNGSSSLAVARGVKIAAGAVTLHDHRPVTPVLFATNARQFADLSLEEIFGPVALVVRYEHASELTAMLRRLEASLVMAIHAEPHETSILDAVLQIMTQMAGRLVWGAATTGLAVGWATHHGGGYPASTSILHTSVGAHAIRRWLRPVSYQGFPDFLLPSELVHGDELFRPSRRINGDIVR